MKFQTYMYTKDYKLQCSTFSIFTYTATSEIYTLSLHDALPICGYTYTIAHESSKILLHRLGSLEQAGSGASWRGRSEEHTSEPQSLTNLVCRLLLEKKKNT